MQCIWQLAVPWFWLQPRKNVDHSRFNYPAATFYLICTCRFHSKTNRRGYYQTCTCLIFFSFKNLAYFIESCEKKITSFITGPCMLYMNVYTHRQWDQIWTHFSTLFHIKWSELNKLLIKLKDYTYLLLQLKELICRYSGSPHRWSFGLLWHGCRRSCCSGLWGSPFWLWWGGLAFWANVFQGTSGSKWLKNYLKLKFLTHH